MATINPYLDWSDKELKDYYVLRDKAYKIVKKVCSENKHYCAECTYKNFCLKCVEDYPKVLIACIVKGIKLPE